MSDALELPDNSKAQRAKEFSERFKLAIELHGGVPDLQKGLYEWFVAKMTSRGIPVRKQSVLRWHHGDSLPTGEKLKLIAELLRVDEGWLAFGRQVKGNVINSSYALDNGSATVLAGFLQLSGFSVRIDENDSDSTLRAVVDRKDVRIVAGTVRIDQNGRMIVHVPVKGIDESAKIIAVMPTGVTSIGCFVIPYEEIHLTGDSIIQIVTSRKGDGLLIGNSPVKWISNFSDVLG